MALYHKWGVKNDFTFVLQFFLLISDSLGCVKSLLSNLYTVVSKQDSRSEEDDANYFALANNNNINNITMKNSENIDVSRCPTTGSKEEVTQSYAHKSVEADSTMQQPEQAKNINIEKTETTESSLPLSSTEVIMMQEVCL